MNKIVNELEEIPELTLIEDLGMMYPTEKSNWKYRFGLYKCGFCGTHFKAQMVDVKRGHTKSCGCYNRKLASLRSTKHGSSNTRLYSTWINIKTRILNTDTPEYAKYGGRGITICEEWKNDFTTFRDWALFNGYSEELSIDRIDNDGNYEPSNCRWTTATIQCRNQRKQKNNTSGFVGVSYFSKLDKYKAYIRVDKILIYLGLHKTALEGAIAYNNYIIENNLEGFNLNIIPELKFKEEEN